MLKTPQLMLLPGLAFGKQPLAIGPTVSIFEKHELERLEGKKPVRRTWYWSQGTWLIPKVSNSGGATTSRPSGVKKVGQGAFAAPSRSRCGKRTV